MAENPADNPKTRHWYNLILHLHPRRVNPYTLRFTLTFGLGGMAAMLVVIQVITGLLLKFHYIPAPEGAYNSILNINEGLLFGKLTHNIHHWSAVILLWVTFLHMLRVLFTGAYSKPRHVTWILGIILLSLVVLANFTGYLLPWDQLSYWAVTVVTSLLQYIPFIGETLKETLLGGNEVGSVTLSNFFNLHTGVIPLIIILLMGFHFWRIRRAGGVITPESEKDTPLTDTYPNLVAREFVVALVLIAFLLTISVIFDAPLRERANPSFSPNPAKAPWYFMGLQELLIHFHPFIVVVVYPLVIIIGSFWLPYLKQTGINQGVWFISEKGKRAARLALLAGSVFTVLFVLISEILPDPRTVLPSVHSLILTGLVPFVIVKGTISIFIVNTKKRYSLSRSEFIQTIVILLVVSYAVLTIIGIFFRGEGMKLMWPWQI
jgi:quinol-cytochrome oxidoreductase complex cytochrome b subunit